MGGAFACIELRGMGFVCIGIERERCGWLTARSAEGVA